MSAERTQRAMAEKKPTYRNKLVISVVDMRISMNYGQRNIYGCVYVALCVLTHSVRHRSGNEYALASVIY